MCAVAMMAQAAQVSPEDAAIVANNFMNVATVSNGAKKAPAKRMVLKTPLRKPMKISILSTRTPTVKDGCWSLPMMPFVLFSRTPRQAISVRITCL